MVDELIDLIKKRKVASLCKRVVQLYTENPKQVLKLFIVLYAKLDTGYNHHLSRTIATRVYGFRNSAFQSKEIVDMYLLLYFNCKREYIVDEDVMKISKNERQELQKHGLMYLIKVASLRKCKQYAYSFYSNKVSSRVTNNKVQAKYSNEPIWDLWNQMINAARTIGPGVTVFCSTQLKIFQHTYDKSQAKKCFGILSSVIDALYVSKRGGRDICMKTHYEITNSHFECMLKINFLFIETGSLKVPSMKEYLYDIALGLQT